jgi:hypothetical protein
VFGALRTSIQQLARVASVEYLRLVASRRPERGFLLLTLCIQCAGLLGVAIGAFVIVDNLRILGLWLKHVDHNLFESVVASFAFSGAFYAYQVFVSLMFRLGDLADVASRQYTFVAYSAAFAVVAVLAKSLPLYLTLVVVSEIMLATSFMLRRKSGTAPDYQLAGRRGLLASTAGLATLLVLWTRVRQDPHATFVSVSQSAVLASLTTVLTAVTVFVIVQALINIDCPGLFPRAGLARIPTARQVWQRCTFRV